METQPAEDVVQVAGALRVVDDEAAVATVVREHSRARAAADTVSDAAGFVDRGGDVLVVITGWPEVYIRCHLAARSTQLLVQAVTHAGCTLGYVHGRH